MTIFMTGAGIQGGQQIGSSDEVGLPSRDQRVTNSRRACDFAASARIDHKRFTYYFNGRNMRLTDVSGELIPQSLG